MSIIHFSGRSLILVDKQHEVTLNVASRIAASRAPVIICGESGTGKELMARFIHEKSDRKTGPFVSINCAAIPEGLLEAELFGYEKGAFTGAVTQRIGKFERASQGTLLLDEVSEMPVHLQAKLLRVLQEEEIERLGGNKTIPIKTRIISTTNRDPLELIQQGRFREDLYYRLSVLRMDCTPLRERPSAIKTLAIEFLRQAIDRYQIEKLEFSSEAIDLLVNHSWPGNIRELQNVIERSTLLAEGPLLEPRHLDLRKGSGFNDSDSLRQLEQTHILKTLDDHKGNRTHTARALGISVRTLRNKIKEYQE